jgi:hypothetical protein
MGKEEMLMRTIPSEPTKAKLVDDPERLIGVDVDPELERQLALAKDNQAVDAVLVLRQSGTDRQHRSSPEALLRRVGRNEMAGAIEHTMLPRLGVLIVRAQARIIRRLIAQPEVAIASANRNADTAE